MNLIRALGLSSGESIAFVGAGGKTSAIQSLAGSLEPPVVITTTTHLGAWQTGLADVHRIIQPDAHLEGFGVVLSQKTLVTGPLDDHDRLLGVAGSQLQSLNQICTQQRIPLLIEADGAGQRPLKAPATYEPAIPDWVDMVVVMAGLSGVGKLLNDAIVHRPERFASLSGLTTGAVVQPEDVALVLGSESGGLKGIPPRARRMLFLNQADDDQSRAWGREIADKLVDRFERILIGSLQSPSEQGTIFSSISPIAGVILAAGGSQRLGTPKQLLGWGGKPFVRQVAETAQDAGLAPLVVVTGAAGGAVAAAVNDLPLTLARNPDWQAGQASSLQAGLAALPEGCQGAIFLLADQPQIPVELIQQLVKRFYEHRMPITAPSVEGRRANPVLFSRETFSELRKLTGDRGGRVLFDRFGVDWLPWADERILLDVDRPGDLEALYAAYDQ